MAGNYNLREDSVQLTSFNQHIQYCQFVFVTLWVGGETQVGFSANFRDIPWGNFSYKACMNAYNWASRVPDWALKKGC